jgi:predicted DNA-binding ribbon-helix-helix protein
METIERMKRSRVSKRSVVIHGHKTSISLEDQFWKGIKLSAANKNSSVATLVETIDHERGHSNLSSACRLYVLEQALAGELKKEEEPHDPEHT